MSRRVTRAYVRRYNADAIEADERHGRLDPHVREYGEEAWARYRGRCNKVFNTKRIVIEEDEDDQGGSQADLLP